MTDNPIDMTGRLPPEVRKPWRQEYPEAYAKRIDELLALEKEVRAMRKRFEEIKRDIEGARPAVEIDTSEWYQLPWRQRLESEHEAITEILVLLKCVDEKIIHTYPCEENMDKESVRQFFQ